MSLSIWQYFLSLLQNKLSPIEYSIWIRPLKVQCLDNNVLELSAPNQFVLDRVKNKYISNYYPLISNHFGPHCPKLKITVNKKLQEINQKSFIIKKKKK
ncbi:MAG: DnaA N-terminal domain-containing protein [Buchnera aphidicola (Eriosoma harunire)]